MIYLDHAATTAMRPEAAEAMLPFFTREYGNPSSIYQFAEGPRRAIAGARRQAAALIGAAEDEIFFTSGGTEADNWALRSSVLGKEYPHIITTAVEHHAVLETCSALERQGASVTRLMPDRRGIITPEQVEEAITPDTVLISVMTVNNEIGTIEPVAEIGQVARRHGIPFHTDGVQAVGHIAMDVNTIPVDMISVSAHKFGGPRGTGFLYIRRGIPLRSLITGGAQERGRRAGTENTPGIVGMGTACSLASADMDQSQEKERRLRDHLLERIMREIPDVRLNGPRPESGRRSANNLSLTFLGVDNEALLILLDMEGICASGGSACATGSLEPSHVLTAIGLDREAAGSTIRLTVGSENTMREMDEAADRIREAAARLRSMHTL